MGSLGRAALAIGVATIGASAAWGTTGCSGSKSTELVPGALTQIQVPRDLAAIRVDVKANGATVLCQQYYADQGTLILPATLGIVPPSGAASGATTTITVEIRGYDAAGVAANPNSNDLQTCGLTPVGQSGGPRLLRRSTQTFVDQHILFLPMPLSYSCFDTDCSTGSDPSAACKGGQCVSSQTDAHKLVDFDPSLVDGTGVDCFNASTCFTGAVSAVPIDANSCLYDFPAPPAPQPLGTGINVRVFYQDFSWVKNPATQQYQQQLRGSSEQEILNADGTEGFSIPDPSKPTQLELAPGLCSLVKAAGTPPAPPTSGTSIYHTISDVQIASACPSKSPLLPLCADQQHGTTSEADGGTSTDVTCNTPLSLVPAPSAIYMVMDDSPVMHGAFGQQGYATAMNLSLADPVFKRTYVGFRFLSHAPSECAGATTSYTSPAVDFGLAAVSQPKIAQLLASPGAPSSSELDLEAAMRLDQGAYKHLLDFGAGVGEPFNVAAVMFFLNRQPDSGAGDAGTGQLGPDCPGQDAKTAIESEAKAAAQAGLQTYFVVLDNDTHQPPIGFFDQIQNDVKPGVTTLDATSPSASTVLTNFANVATALGTCLYELPPGVDSSAQMTFTIPIPTPVSSVAPVPVPVPFAAGCNAQSSVDGWNVDSGRIRICGNSCQNLRSSIEAVTAVTLQAAQGSMTPPNVPEVPVTVTMPCKAAAGH